jgi:hypothetical protein
MYGYRSVYRIYLRERDHLEDLGVYGRTILKCISIQDVGWGAWTGFISLRIGTGGSRL